MYNIAYDELTQDHQFKRSYNMILCESILLVLLLLLLLFIQYSDSVFAMKVSKNEEEREQKKETILSSPY